MITCPADAVLVTSNLGTTGDCAAQYTWDNPLPTDNCTLENYTVTFTNPDGTIDGPDDVFVYSVGNYPGGTGTASPNRNFDVGVTTVTYYVEDIYGNTNTCSFTVTVTDDEDPYFVNCPPAGFITDVFTNECETSVTWAIPVAEDNCTGLVLGTTGSTGVIQTGGPTYGSLLGPGMYTIEYTATDEAGNTAICTFDINVIDTENPIITCPSQSIFTIAGTDDDVCSYLVTTDDLNPDVSEN
jgi:hypothetical protein